MLLHDKDTLITEVINLRKQQDATQRMLAATLNELHETRCEQQRTQDTIEKVVSFLSTVVDEQGKLKISQGITKSDLTLTADAGNVWEPGKRAQQDLQEKPAKRAKQAHGLYPFFLSKLQPS